MSDAHIRIGTRVRELRNRRGWTQEMLGERAGLSYKFVGEVERGTGNPSIDSIAAMARAFSVDISELFRRDGVEATYGPLSADDASIVRDAKATLSSLEEVVRRLNARPKERARTRKKR